MGNGNVEIGLCALLAGLLGALHLIVQLGPDVAFKRRWFPVCVGLIWVLMAVFGVYGLWPRGAQATASAQAPFLPFVALPISVAGFLATIRIARFCPNCARLCADGDRLSPPVRCSKCGTPL